MKNELIATLLLFSINILSAQVSEDLLVNIHSVTNTEMNSLNPNPGSLVFNTSTNKVYAYDGTLWEKVSNNNAFGDIKSGIQQNDHNGWVKLDGRAITELTVTQQVQANAFGFQTNLPNASNTYLSQNGSTLGSVSGSNTKTIARNQLPLFTLEGNTNAAQNGVSIRGSYNSGRNANPTRGHWAVIGDADNHNHTFITENINNTGAQQTLNTTPATLSVTMFIYLGN